MRWMLDVKSARSEYPLLVTRVAKSGDRMAYFYVPGRQSFMSGLRSQVAGKLGLRAPGARFELRVASRLDTP